MMSIFPSSTKSAAAFVLLLFGLSACKQELQQLSGNYKGTAAGGEATTKSGPVGASNLSVTLQVDNGDSDSPTVMLRVMGMSDLARTVECTGAASRTKDGELETLTISEPKCDAGGTIDPAYKECGYTASTIVLKQESSGKFALASFDAKLNDGARVDICQQSTSILALAGVSAKGLAR